MTARFKLIKYMFKPPVLYGLSMKCAMPSFQQMFEPEDQTKDQLGGVGHCLTWHVQVGLGFKIEELVHSGLCAM